MSKPLLIALLVAVLSGIVALVWWQAASYDRHEENLKKQLDEEQQLRKKNRPYAPASTSDRRPVDGRGTMSVYL